MGESGGRMCQEHAEGGSAGTNKRRERNDAENASGNDLRYSIVVQRISRDILRPTRQHNR